MTSWLEKLDQARAEQAERDRDPWRELLERLLSADVTAISTSEALRRAMVSGGHENFETALARPDGRSGDLLPVSCFRARYGSVLRWSAELCSLAIFTSQSTCRADLDPRLF
jgi:hypothetical protein